MFRGSDIKDIRVVNNVPRVPNDPAIMQMHVSNQMGQPNFQSQFPIPMVPHPVGQVGPFGANNPAGAPYNPIAGLSSLSGNNAQLPPGGLPFGQQQPQPSLQQQPQQQSQQSQQQQQVCETTFYVSICLGACFIVFTFHM